MTRGIAKGREPLWEAYADELLAAYHRGMAAGLTPQELADVTLSRAYACIQLTFDLDEEQFWRMVAVTAKNYVVSGGFEETKKAPILRAQ